MHSTLRRVWGVPQVKQNLLRIVSVNNTTDATVNSTDQTSLKSFDEIPGPSSLPFIGQLLHFLPGGKLSDMIKVPDMLQKEYGPISRVDIFGNPPFVMLFDAESCAQVLRGENWLPVRPGFTSLTYYRKKYKKDKNNKPTGLLTEHLENWKHIRSAVNPVMMQPKTIQLYSSMLEEIADDMIARMKSLRNEKNMLDAQFDTEMNIWALESIGLVALGGRLHCLDRNLPEDSPEKKLIKCVHDIFNIANELDFTPSIWRYVTTPAFKKGMRMYQEQEELTRYFIKRAMDDLKAKGDTKKSEGEKGVLEKLLDIDEDIAVAMAADMLFAGIDTAATSVTGALYLLANNPDKQTKLREELKVGDPKKYLKACIKESMRIMPVISGNIRQATKDYNILGYKIPKDTYVVLNHQILSLNENQYPRPKEYVPERWIDKGCPMYHGNAHPFSFSPFGFGVRMCIGRRIAELEIEKFLAKVIQNFEVEWFGPPVKIKQSSLNYIVGPYNFIFKDAK